LAGLVGGYFLAVIIGLVVSPDSPQGPIPFIFTVWPAVFVASLWWGARLDRRARPEKPGFDVVVPADREDKKPD
jgi:hypothetical protein